MYPLIVEVKKFNNIEIWIRICKSTHSVFSYLCATVTKIPENNLKGGIIVFNL